MEVAYFWFWGIAPIIKLKEEYVLKRQASTIIFYKLLKS